MPRHRQPQGRHRTPAPPSSRTPAVLASAVVGAAAAAFSTAAASADGLTAMAADAVAPHSSVADQAPGGQVLAGGVAAEVPMAGRSALSAAEARQRVASTRATRAARARQVALMEAARPKWVLPMPAGSYRITSTFGPRWGVQHGGLDMAAPTGTPVFAAGDGVVLEPVGTSGFGNVVVVRHAGGEVSIYGHNSKVLVEPGERVRAGQLVALVGSSGISTGNHLHFEVRRAGIASAALDTTVWLTAHGITV